mgnify:CR=1 FL=1
MIFLIKSVTLYKIKIKLFVEIRYTKKFNKILNKAYHIIGDIYENS